MKNLILMLALLVSFTFTSCVNKNDAPQPQSVNQPVTPPVLSGLYAYLYDTASVNDKSGNVEFTSDSIFYKNSGYACSCTVDTTINNVSRYIYSHNSNGDFVEQISTNQFTYYQYSLTTSKGFVQYKFYHLYDKTTIPSDTNTTNIRTFGKIN